MDLIQLEHFLAVVDERTFTRAAERVFRTQSALSQSIKKLEEYVGTPLLARDLNGVSLTAAGKSFVLYARNMLTMRDQATRSIMRLQNLESGTLSIAAHESAELYFLPAPLLKFFHSFPEIKLDIQRARLTDIPRKVLDREVQIGFVKEAPVSSDLVSVDVHTDRMTIIASPDHPLASKATVSIKDLDSVSLVVHHLCSSTEETVLRLFRQNSLRCNVVADVWSFESIKKFVAAGVGIAMVPRITVLEELRARTLIELPLFNLDAPRRTVMIFRRDYNPEPANELIAIMRKGYPTNLHQIAI